MLKNELFELHDTMEKVIKKFANYLGKFVSLQAQHIYQQGRKVAWKTVAFQ